MGVLAHEPGRENGYIEASSVMTGTAALSRPLALPNKTDGRKRLALRSGHGAVSVGQGGDGLNNIGLLVRTLGQVTLSGRGWFYIDDAARVSDGSGILGIYVDAGGMSRLPREPSWP